MMLQTAGFLLLMMVGVTMAASQYMMVIPKELRNGMDFQVDIALVESAKTDVSATISIRQSTTFTSPLAWDNAELTINIATGQSQGRSSIVVPYSVPAGQTYYVHVRFVGITVKTLPEQVKTQRLESPIFIQTDKPIYKPSDQVCFRVLALDQMLKPLQESFTMELKNPDGNLLMKRTAGNPNEVDYKPLVSDCFKLSDDPVLGTHTISAYTDTAYAKLDFDVEKYVLPKFEVVIELDKPWGVEGKDSAMTGVVKAIYSYGVAVKGTLTLLADGDVIMKNVEIDGQKPFSIPVSGYQEFKVYGMSSKRLSLEATVAEALTGNEMSDSTSFVMYLTDFKPTLEDPLPIYYNGSDSYTFKVFITDPVGVPIQTNLNDYNLKCSEYGRPVQSVRVERNPTEITVDLRDVKSDGYPNIRVSVERGEVTSAFIQVQPPTYFRAGDMSLDIVMTTDTEAKKCFELTPFNSGDMAFYQIVDNFEANPIKQYIHQGVNCFDVERRHSPKSMIVAYKVDAAGAENHPLIIAHHVVEAPWTTEQQVSLSISPETVEPDGEVMITITTSGQGYIALSGIDKRLTFLADLKEVSQAAFKEMWESGRMFGPGEKKTVYNPMFDGGFIMEDVLPRCFDCGFGGYSQYMDAFKVLENAGLKIITDLFIYKDESRGEWPIYDDRVMFMNAAGGDVVMEDVGNGANADMDKSEDANKESVTTQTKPARKNFPEVWLWSVEQVGQSGVLELRKIVPDSITNWIVSAYAFNSQHGVGVAPSQEVTVMKDIFISLNLPYSVVRGEIFNLPISVFNYRSKNVEVQVELFDSDGLEILNDEDGFSLRAQMLAIDAGTSGLVEIPVRFTAVGNVVLKVNAFLMTENASQMMAKNIVDEVNKMIRVVPEGREISHDFSMQLAMPVTESLHLFNTSNLYQEPDIILDSLRIKLSITGDMMGPVIAAIGAGIKMPYGCGEQNIQSLTPGLFGTLYLRTIDRLSRELEDKVAAVCETGYRKELVFKHPDGSYSAFGAGAGLCNCGSQGQKKGSTWLTAYVLKMFSLLYKHELIFVDFNILVEAFQFMNTITNPDCVDQYFLEMGELIHTEMQGGTSSRFGFNAFVLIAVLEFRDAAQKAGNVTAVQAADTLINEASSWLLSNTDDLKDTKQPYQLAIVSYALAKASNNNAGIANELLMEAVELIESGQGPNAGASQCQAKPLFNGERYQYCETDRDCASDSGDTWRYRTQQCCHIPCGGGRKACTYVNTYGYGHTTSSSRVETHGYVLMAALQLHQGNTEMKQLADRTRDKLLEMRDASGFFVSTQDTAVALEALTLYSIEFPNTDGADFLIYGHIDGSRTSDGVRIGRQNYVTRKELGIPAPSGTFPENIGVVVVNGNFGTAFINLVVKYNVRSELKDKPLVLDLEPGIHDNNELFVKQCVKKNADSEIQLGTMIVVSLYMQTGNTFSDIKAPDNADLAPAKYEVENEGTRVNVYYMKSEDEFMTERCVEVVYERNFKVDDPKPAVGEAMDYYDQENSVVMLYSAPITDGKKPTTGASAARVSITLMAVVMIFLMLVRSV